MTVLTQNPSDRDLAVSGAAMITRIHGGQVGAISAAILAGTPFLADKRYSLIRLVAKVGTTGTAGQTDIDVNLDGTPVAGMQLTFLHSEANGLTKSSGPTAETIVEPGHVVSIEATAAPTAGADLTCYAELAEVLG